MSKFDQVLGQGGKDEFVNFQFEPPKSVGRLRPFISRRNRFRAFSRGIKTVNEGIPSLSGSSQNLLDQSKLMNLQEDAKARRISSEIMKHRLYESVVSTPRRRRMTTSIHEDPTDLMHSSFAYMQHPARMAMSMPVTPATSQRTTPAHSPTQTRRFMFGFFSRGGTPGMGNTPEDDLMDIDGDDDIITEEGSTRGLASIFTPKPRYIPGAQWMGQDEDYMSGVISKRSPQSSHRDLQENMFTLQDVPPKPNKSRLNRSPSSSDGED